VEPEVHDNQGNHSQGEIKMYVAVIVSVHAPERQSMTATTARRQNVMNQEASPNLSEEYEEGENIYQKVQGTSLHSTFLFSNGMLAAVQYSPYDELVSTVNNLSPRLSQ
jgi:hypothetical protein